MKIGTVNNYLIAEKVIDISLSIKGGIFPEKEGETYINLTKDDVLELISFLKKYVKN